MAQIPNPNKDLKDRRILSRFYDEIIKQIDGLVSGVAGVSSVNGVSGAVTLDAGDIAPTANRFYLTAGQASAIATNSGKTSYTDAATVADNVSRLNALENSVLLTKRTDIEADTPIAGQTTIYIAQANPGSAESDFAWRIEKNVLNDEDDIIDGGFAGGETTQNKQWTLRASYVYS